MAKTVTFFRIYDTKDDEYLPGEHGATQVKKLLNSRTNPYKAADNGTLISERYLCFRAEDFQKGGFAEEWDKARHAIRRVFGKE